MKVVILEHTPAVLKIPKLNTFIYKGVEVKIIEALALALNFTLSFYESLDTESEKWGRMQSNGTMTGLLAEMVERNADFALGDLHNTLYHLAFIDLTIPYGTECLTFLTPAQISDNSWKTLILPFSPKLWIGVLSSLFCVGFIFYTLSTINRYLKNPLKSKFNKNLIKKERKDLFDKFSNCIMYTYSMVFVVSLPKLPKRWSIRLLTGWFMIYCLLVAVSYRASLTAILANPSPRVTIDTMEQLAESPIGCGAWGNQIKDFFLTSLDEAGQKIGAKMIETNYPEAVIKDIIKGSFSFYENEYFLQEMIHKRRDDVEKETLHVMKECAIHMPISLGLFKNSPIKPKVDTFMRRLIEAGLTNKWLADSIQKFQSSIENEPQEALMDLKKMYGAFVALATGYLLALIALIGENIYWKFVTQRHPNYDKLFLAKLYKK